MWSLDAYHLARIQFAFTIGVHIVFPASSIGLAAYLTVLEGLWLRTGRQVYMDVYRYWLTIFAVVFGIGVVTGLVMSYEFGTNWSDFARRTGSILGPLLGYETLTAFFIEAGFLGIMLFGLNRVGKKLHFAATCLVAIGTHISAGWIMASNAWMQTPVGYKIVDGVFVPVSWLHIIFNPSYPYRLVHMLGAAYLSVAFVVGAVGAFHLLRNSTNQAARVMFSMAMWMAVCATPLQIVAGDVLGENTLRYQPQKVAAMEGDWHPPQPGAGEPLVLCGLPDQEAQINRAEVAIPHIGSLYLTHSWSGTIQSLSEFPPSEIPYVPIVVYAFRIMVGLGMLMFGTGLISLLLRHQGRLYITPWFQRLVDLSLIWAAMLAFAVFAYVVLDGFDLGTGILFLMERGSRDRDVMVNTVAPVWDGNETWLVLGGGGLFAAFPLAYAVIMPAMYPLIIGMLLALVLRGVAFEFRFQATKYGRFWWDLAFGGGSIVAALCQGMILGGLTRGIQVEDNAYAGGWWDWLNGFTVLCGIAVVIGYALLGACWLVWRTSGALRDRCRRYAGVLAVLTLGLIVVVSLWTPLLHPQFMERWFGWPGIVLTSPVPLLMVVVTYLFGRGLVRGHDVTPLLCAEAWFLLCFVGLGISYFPYIIPPSITIWQAAAPASSQGFLLIGATVMIPIILTYMAYSYWTFAGKVEPGAHYH